MGWGETQRKHVWARGAALAAQERTSHFLIGQSPLEESIKVPCVCQCYPVSLTAGSNSAHSISSIIFETFAGVMTSLTPAMQGGTCGLQAFQWPVQTHPYVCEIPLDHRLKHIAVSGVLDPVWEAVSTVGRRPE